MEESDVSRGSSGRHVETGLLESAGLVHCSGKSSNTASYHQELINHLVTQLIFRIPNQFLKIFVSSGILFGFDNIRDLINCSLITCTNFDFSSVFKQHFIFSVIN